MIQGERQYLWCAVEQYGDVIDILVQPRRAQKAAKRFFRKLLKGEGRPPWRLVTDKLRSYSAAHRKVMPSVVHHTDQHRNNLAEVSHEPTRQRERQMRKFKTPGQAQRFLTVHGLVQNLFRVGRHLLPACHPKRPGALVLSSFVFLDTTGKNSIASGPTARWVTDRQRRKRFG